MTESIFSSQTPALVNQQDSTYTLGTLFSSDVDGYVTGCRAYIGAVPTSPVPTGLLYEWVDNENGVLLASKPFGTLVAGQWNDILFDTPVAIDAGKDYVTAWGPTNNYSATGGFFNSAPVVNGHLTSPQSFAAKYNGKFHVGTSIAYPNESFNAGCYFVDLLFELEIGEPSYSDNRFFFGAAS